MTSGLFETAYDSTFRPADESVLMRAALSFTLRTQIDDLLMILPPEDFGDVGMGELWSLATKLRERNSYITKQNLIGIHSEIGTGPSSRLERIIAHADGNPVNFGEAKRAAELVKVAANSRRLVEAVKATMERVIGGGELEVYGAALDRFYQEVGKLQIDTSAMDGLSASEAIEQWWDWQDNPAEGAIPTPWWELNQIMPGGGARPGQLIFGGARPGVGKSVLLTQIAYEAAKSGKHVLLYTLEMTYNQVMSRIIANATNVPLRAINNGEMTQEQREKVAAWQEEHQDLPLTIVARGGASVAEIRAHAKALKRSTGCDMIVIDYFQILGMPKAENRLQALTEATGALKRMALELELPVWTAAQLRRPAEGQEKARPFLSQLRESGSIEQDADIVILLHRDTTNPDCDEIEFIVDKNRDGMTRPLKFFWHGGVSRIGIPD